MRYFSSAIRGPKAERARLTVAAASSTTSSGTTGKAGPDKKKIRWSEAWQEASVLIWSRRGRLGLGLALMFVNRLSGLVLPGTTKLLIDDVFGRGRHELLMPDRARGRRGDARAGGHLVRPVTGARRGGAAGHHRDAAGGPRAHHAPAGPLLRHDAERRAHLARDVGCGWHPQPRRDRTRAAHRQRGDCGLCAGRALLSELEADARHARRARVLRRRDGLCVQAAAADLPRAGEDQRRGHRPALAGPGRDPRRQGLHRREARADRLRRGCASPAAERHLVDDRRLRPRPPCRPSSSASSA